MNEQQLHLRLALIRSRAGARVVHVEHNARLARTSRLQGLAGRSIAAPMSTSERRRQVQRLITSRRTSG
jgi:hypothetical protein